MRLAFLAYLLEENKTSEGLQGQVFSLKQKTNCTERCFIRFPRFSSIVGWRNKLWLKVIKSNHKLFEVHVLSPNSRQTCNRSPLLLQCTLSYSAFAKYWVSTYCGLGKIENSDSDFVLQNWQGPSPLCIRKVPVFVTDIEPKCTKIWRFFTFFGIGQGKQKLNKPDLP